MWVARTLKSHRRWWEFSLAFLTSWGCSNLQKNNGKKRRGGRDNRPLLSPGHILKGFPASPVCCVELQAFRICSENASQTSAGALGRGSESHPSNPNLDLAPGTGNAAQPCQHEIHTRMPRIRATDIDGKSVLKTRVPTELKQVQGLLAAVQRFTRLYFCILALTCDLNFTWNGALFWCLQCCIVTECKSRALCLCRFVSAGH